MSGGGAEGEAPSGASSLPAFSLPVSLSLKRSNETLENHATTQRSPNTILHINITILVYLFFSPSKKKCFSFPKKKKKTRATIKNKFSTCTFPDVLSIYHYTLSPFEFPETLLIILSNPGRMNPYQLSTASSNPRMLYPRKTIHRFTSIESPNRAFLSLEGDPWEFRSETTRSLLATNRSFATRGRTLVDQPQAVTSIIRFITE